MQDPLAMNSIRQTEKEDILLVKPDFRYCMGNDDSLNEGYPPYVEETVGTCGSCIPLVCIPCPCSCRELHKRHEKNPRWFSGFLNAPGFGYSTMQFENHRSQALGIWNLVAALGFIMLCASPIGSSVVRGGTCESIFSVAPKYISFWEDGSGQSPLPNKNIITINTRLPDQSLQRAKAKCEAACSNTTPSAVLRAAMIDGGKTETCGVFTSVYDFSEGTDAWQPSFEFFNLNFNFDPFIFDSDGLIFDTVKTIYMNLFARMFFVSSANSKSLRMVGWGGVNVMLAFAMDIFLLIQKYNDVTQYCSVHQLQGHAQTAERSLERLQAQNLTTFTCRFDAEKIEIAVNETGPILPAPILRQFLQRFGFLERSSASGILQWEKVVPLTFHSLETKLRDIHSAAVAFKILGGKYPTLDTTFGQNMGKKIAHDGLFLEKAAHMKRDQSVATVGSVWVTLKWIDLASILIELLLLVYIVLKHIHQHSIAFRDWVRRGKKTVNKCLGKLWKCKKSKFAEIFRMLDDHGTRRSDKELKFRMPSRVIIAWSIGLILVVFSSVQITAAIGQWRSVFDDLEKEIPVALEDVLMDLRHTAVQTMSNTGDQIGMPQIMNTIIDSTIVPALLLHAPANVDVSGASRSCLNGPLRQTFAAEGTRFEEAFTNQMKAAAVTAEPLSMLLSVSAVSSISKVMNKAVQEFDETCKNTSSAILNDQISCILTAVNASINSTLNSSSIRDFKEHLTLLLNKTVPTYVCNIVSTKYKQAPLSLRHGTDVIIALLKMPKIKGAIASIVGDGTDVARFITGDGSLKKGTVGPMFQLLEDFWSSSGTNKAYSIQNANDCVFVIRVFIQTCQYVLLMTNLSLWSSILLCIVNMVLFLKSLYWTGSRQLEAIIRHFDPVEGYNKALAGNTLNMVDVSLIRGRYFSKRQMRFLAYDHRHTETDHAQNIRYYLGNILRYRRLHLTTGFIGMYPFVLVFSLVLVASSLSVVSIVLFSPIAVVITAPQHYFQIFGKKILEFVPVLAVVFFVGVMKYFSAKCIGVLKASHAGPKHTVAFAYYDGLLTIFQALVGFVPAILRIVGVLLLGVSKVARPDYRLAPYLLDGVHNSYLGILEEMRMRAEFRVRRRSMCKRRNSQSRDWSANPIGSCRRSELEEIVQFSTIEIPKKGSN